MSLLMFLLLSSVASAFSFDDLSTKLKYSDIAEYTLCYEDMDDGGYFVSSSTLSQLINGYTQVFGAEAIDDFDLQSVKSLTFHDHQTIYTLVFQKTELEDGNHLEVTSIIKSSSNSAKNSSRTYKHDTDYQNFSEAFDYLVGFNEEPSKYPLGEIYNRYAVLKGFRLGMSKASACELLQRFEGPLQTGEYGEGVGSNFEYCGYNSESLIAQGSTLKFRNDQLIEYYLDPALVNHLYHAQNFTTDEFADALILNVPWLADGLSGEIDGWSFVSSLYKWKFYINENWKALTVTDLSL
jgi:hypothetical protein